MNLKKYIKNKKNVLNIIFIVFLLVSIFYLNYLYIKKSNNEAYSRGLDTAFELIMKQAKNKNCDTVNITNNIETIKLLNINCVK